MSAVVSAYAQQMPDPSQIHGKAIPAPELGNSIVTVRLVRQTIANNVPQQTVKITKLNPLDGRTVTVYVAVLPRLTDCDAGLTESEKSAGTVVTVTLALPETPPLAAVTVKGPPGVAAAENKPDDEIVPPLTDQVKLGCGFIG